LERDEPILAFDIVRLLQAAGAEVKGPVFGLERALELANLEHLNCAFLDVTLWDGLVFAAASLFRGKGVGILFYTGIAILDQGRSRIEVPIRGGVLAGPILLQKSAIPIGFAVSLYGALPLGWTQLAANLAVCWAYS
jgi:hypothetical protein